MRQVSQEMQELLESMNCSNEETFSTFSVWVGEENESLPRAFPDVDSSLRSQLRGMQRRNELFFDDGWMHLRVRHEHLLREVEETEDWD